MAIVTLAYQFRQSFRVPAQSAYAWCTDFGPSDGPLFSERTQRAVHYLSDDALVMTDTTYLQGRTRKIRRLVRLVPSELAWTNTHLDGPFRHSRYLVSHPIGRPPEVPPRVPGPPAGNDFSPPLPIGDGTSGPAAPTVGLRRVADSARSRPGTRPSVGAIGNRRIFSLGSHRAWGHGARSHPPLVRTSAWSPQPAGEAGRRPGGPPIRPRAR